MPLRRLGRLRALVALAALSSAAAVHAAGPAPAPLDCALAIGPGYSWVRAFGLDGDRLPPGADPATAVPWGASRPWPSDGIGPDGRFSDLPSPMASATWRAKDLSATLSYELATAPDGTVQLAAHARIQNRTQAPLRPRDAVLVGFGTPPPPPAPGRLPAIVDPAVPLSATFLPAPPAPCGTWLPVPLPPIDEIPADGERSVAFATLSFTNAVRYAELDRRSAYWPTPADGVHPRAILELQTSNADLLPPARATVDGQPAATDGAWDASAPLRFVLDAPDADLVVHRARPRLGPRSSHLEIHHVDVENTSDAPHVLRLLERPDAARRWTLDSSTIPPKKFDDGTCRFDLTVPAHASASVEWTLRLVPR